MAGIAISNSLDIEEILADASILSEVLEGRFREILTKVDPNTSLQRVPHGYIPLQLRLYLRMLSLLPLGTEGSRVRSRMLVTNAGDGYLLALADALGIMTYAVEADPSFAQQTRHTLDRYGHTGIALKVGSQARGWHDNAPFDAILVGSIEDQVPRALLAQLSNRNGALVSLIKGRRGTRLYHFKNHGGVVGVTKLEKVFLPL